MMCVLVAGGSLVLLQYSRRFACVGMLSEGEMIDENMSRACCRREAGWPDK